MENKEKKERERIIKIIKEQFRLEGKENRERKKFQGEYGLGWDESMKYMRRSLLSRISYKTEKVSK